MSFYHPGPEFRRGRRSDVNWKPGMDEGRPGGFWDDNGDGIIQKPYDHGGIDWSAPIGTPIRAAAEGIVVWSGLNHPVGDPNNTKYGYGYTVIIKHTKENGDEFYTLYSHMDGMNMVKLGDVVLKGQKIGQVGNTGQSDGPHLHYEVIDPIFNSIVPRQDYTTGGPINLDGSLYRKDPSQFNEWPATGVYNWINELINNSIKPSLISIFPINPDDWQILFTTATSLLAPRGDPLILDLDGDGTETIGVTGGAYFDHDANGFAEQTGWAGSDDGLLVWDRNGNGVIDSGRELFGDQTLLKNNTRASHGFEALAEWDDNLDGKIDLNDSIWSNLRIWRDFDRDGYSSTDEIYTLNDHGITSLNTGYTNVNSTDPNGNIQMLAGTFRKADGTTGQMNNYALRLDRTYTIANEWLEVPSDIATLPDLQGYGNVYNLHQAMVRDTGGQLKALVEQFITSSDISMRNSLMEQILFKWTGSQGINPTSRGPNIDARRLAVLEKLFGQPFVGIGGPDPNANAATLLNQSYWGLFEMFYAGLVSQTHLKDIYDKITYTWDEGSQSLRGDLGAVKAELENRYAQDQVVGKTLVEEFARTLKGLGAEMVLGLDTLRSNETFGWFIDSYGFSSKIEGTNGNDTLTGTASADAIRGGDGNDTILGGNGNDVLLGQSGDDLLDGGLGSDTLIGGLGNDTLGGAWASDDWYGTGGGNTYEGGLGNDTLRGTLNGDLYRFNLGDGQDVVVEPNYYMVSGTDTLRFGSGINPSDIQVVRSGNDLVFKHINGTDRVTVKDWYASGYTQLERVEFWDGTFWSGASVHAQGLVVSGTEGNDTLNGVDAYGDTLYGLGGNDTLYGYGGNDTLDGGSGDDLLDGGLGSDTLIGGLGNDTLGGAWASDDWYGTGGGNTYEGGLGNDTLRGTLNGDLYRFNLGDGQDVVVEPNYYMVSGTDTLRFGSGINPSDIQVVRSGNDLVFKHINGTDRVTVKDWYVSGYCQIERIEFNDGSVFNLTDLQLGTTSTDTLNGTSSDSVMMGDAGNDTLSGGAGNDLINGGSGTDTMTGGPGNDTYIVSDAGDAVTESLNEGTDTIYSSITFTLGANIENLILTGASAINATGNTLANLLRGNSANNVLNGKEGADTLIGGLGNDTYVVDNIGDTVTENLNEGTDTVQSYITYTLGANLENLTLMGASAINGTGNSLNNTLTGNSAANVLAGGLGNDTYVVGTGDTVVENINEGTDTIQSSVTYTLGSNLENLTLTGSSAINGTGNELNNSITGNSASNILTGGLGNDTLNGGTGADILIGGLGNDIYVVDNIGDIVTEGINEGTDTVQSSITYTLPSNVENLTLTGSSAINATGNELNNTLTGNSGANILSGNAGNDTIKAGAGTDTLDGGAGNDTLEGSTGNDLYLFGRGYGQDSVKDYDTTAGNSDKVKFFDLNPIDLIFVKSGNNLNIQAYNSTDMLTVQNQNLSSAYQVETFEASDGKRLISSYVGQLIQAMAEFSASTGMNWTQLIENRRTDVETILAQYWQPPQ